MWSHDLSERTVTSQASTCQVSKWMKAIDSSADRLPCARHTVVPCPESHFVECCNQFTMTLRLEAPSSRRAMPSPCMHLQSLVPSRCIPQQKISLVSPRKRSIVSFKCVTRCQIGRPHPETHREQSRRSAVPDDSSSQQSQTEHKAFTLGTIIRNAAKTTAIAALVLAAVRFIPTSINVTSLLRLGSYVENIE